MLKQSLASAIALMFLTGTASAQTNSAQTEQAAPNQASPAGAGKEGQATQSGIRQADVAKLTMTFYTVVAPTDILASTLIGLDVHNLQNEDIGEIEDLIIDNGKTLRAVVVSVGGFLGVGDRRVAVEPGSLIISREQGGDLKAIANTTREDLKNAPEFKFEGNLTRRNK